MRRLLIIGGGDVARRAALWFGKRLGKHCKAFVLLRRPETAAMWRGLGAIPVAGDLDRGESLSRLAGIADQVLHLAPPQKEGRRDLRTRRLLAALEKGESLPQRLVYVSTTGVYGDCAGARIDETAPRRPSSDRAIRRLDAEETLRRWGASRNVQIVILRAPGIYAADRLPDERLRLGLPTLVAEEDIYSNHIHADDLARACALALFRGGAGRSFNVADDSEMRLGEWFDRVAEHLSLPFAPRVTRDALAKALPASRYSFWQESRRLKNTRMKRELRFSPGYPTPLTGLRDFCADGQ